MVTKFLPDFQFYQNFFKFYFGHSHFIDINGADVFYSEADGDKKIVKMMEQFLNCCTTINVSEDFVNKLVGYNLFIRIIWMILKNIYCVLLINCLITCVRNRDDLSKNNEITLFRDASLAYCSLKKWISKAPRIFFWVYEKMPQNAVNVRKCLVKYFFSTWINGVYTQLLFWKIIIIFTIFKYWF